MLTCGIIGPGQMGRIRGNAFTKAGDVKILWVLSKNGESAERLAKELGCDKAGKWDNRDEITKETPVDFVLIETPHDEQDACTKWALEQNAHVFIGGPLALNPSAAEEIVRLAQAKNRLLSTGLEQAHTFYPEAYGYLKHLGEIIDIDSNAEFPADPKSWYYSETRSGGMPHTHAYYCFIAPMEQLLSDYSGPKVIHATSSQNVYKGADDVASETCHATLTWKHKTTQQEIVYRLRASYVESSEEKERWHITIRGTKGVMKLIPPLDSPGGEIMLNIAGKREQIKTGAADPFQVEAAAFLRAIRENKPELILNSGERGLKLLQVIDQIEESIKKNSCQNDKDKIKISEKGYNASQFFTNKIENKGEVKSSLLKLS